MPAACRAERATVRPTNRTTPADKLPGSCGSPFGGRPAGAAYLRVLQNSSFLPTAFRANDHVRIGFERYCRGGRCCIAHHFDIIEIREHEFSGRVGNRKAALAPELYQPLLRIGAHAGVALRPTKLDAGADELPRQAGASELLADHQPFQFGKIGTIPNA